MIRPGMMGAVKDRLDPKGQGGAPNKVMPSVARTAGNSKNIMEIALNF